MNFLQSRVKVSRFKGRPLATLARCWKSSEVICLMALTRPRTPSCLTRVQRSSATTSCSGSRSLVSAMVIDFEELVIVDDADGKLEWKRMIKVGEVHEKSVVHERAMLLSLISECNTSE